jgi:Bacterial PH domain
LHFVSSQQDEAFVRGNAPAAGRADPAAPGDKIPGQATEDGRTVFRRATPFVAFWVWVAFVIFNLVQVAFPDHDYFSIELTVGLLAVTGLMYACALRPRVIADADAVVVRNPYRDHILPWGAVNGVYLAESVEFSCARPAQKKDKIIYCWALHTGRRSRRRAQQRAAGNPLRGAGRAPAELAELAKQDAVALMAAELGRRSMAARQRGVPAAVLESRWAWLPLACLLVPAAALLALILAR